MYLRKRHAHEIEYIKELYKNHENKYIYEKTNISGKELARIVLKNKLIKKSGVSNSDRLAKERIGGLSEYRNSYYYELLCFCQSLGGEVYGNILPYFDKYGIRKLKEMFKLSKTINNENEN